MATNNFKPFAIGSGANVTSQADYEALAALATGFQAGKASSAQINKALRQATVMAYVLAQYISDTAAVDVLDNGSPATLLANLKAGLLSSNTGRLLGAAKVFTASGSYTKTPGTRLLRVRVWGAGAGGQGMSAADTSYTSGAAGAYAESYVDVSGVSSSIPVIVGVGGNAVAAGSSAFGGAGGDSSFGSYITCTGGKTNASGTTGGIATGGNIFNVSGQTGQGGRYASSLSSIIGGTGGSAFGAYSALPHSSIPGDTGGYPGGGGAVGCFVSSSTSYASGAGASGRVIIEEYA